MKKTALFCSAAVLVGLLLNQSAQGAAQIWNNTGTDFNTPGNWTTTTPGAGDVAKFTAAVISQPNLSMSVSIAGIFFNGAATSGYDITATGGSTFTLTGYSTSGSSGTSNSSAAAIRSDITSGTNTIDVPIMLAPASTGQSSFVQAAGGTLILNGAISSVAGTNLSLRGGGTIQLNGNNSFSTGSIDTAGEIVILGNDNALGAGTFSVNSTATLQASGTGTRTLANSIVFSGTTTVSGSNAFVINGNVATAGSNARTINISNTGGTTFNGSLTLQGTTAGATLSVGGTSAVRFNGVVQDGAGGAGSLVYNGSSTLTLSIANTYSGGTSVSGGTVIAAADGALGTGNVSLTAASVTLTLQSGLVNNYIADSANLNIQMTTGTVNLNFIGTDVVGSLTVAGVQQAAGIYGGAGSGAPNILPELMGTGTLTVVPEPATYMLFGIGLLACAQRFRSRSKKA